MRINAEVWCELVAAEALQRWHERPESPWLEVQFRPGGVPVVVPDAQLLRDEILSALASAARRQKEVGTTGLATLRGWVTGNRSELLLDVNRRLLRRWRFAAEPLRGAIPRPRRGRVALPVAQQFVHFRPDHAAVVCLISSDRMLAEWCRSTLSEMQGCGLWQTISLRLAVGWLLAHPQCPCLLMDANDGLWCLVISSQDAAVCCERPQSCGEWRRQLRKIFHHRVESAL